MKILKKIFSVILCVLIVIGSAPLAGLVGLELPELNLLSAKAEATTNYSGTCGDNLNWTFDESLGKLVIDGSGDMTEWSFYSYVPWCSICSSVKSVVICDTVTSIGNYAFYNCENLTSVTIPDNVTSIGKYVFNGCVSLTDIIIGCGVTNIGEKAFSSCSKLSNVNYTGDLADWCGIEFAYSESNPMYFADNMCINGVLLEGDIIIPDGLTSIGSYSFVGCDSLTSITIPDGVISIGESTFSGCSNLTNVTIPESVTIIENDTFRGCESLTSITIPDSVTIIGYDAFKGCKSLTSITIPDSVTSIGEEAFSGCNNLGSVTIGNGITSIGNYAFVSTLLYWDSSNWDNDVFYVDNCLIEAKKSISETYSIKNGTKLIADHAFYNCSKLKSIIIPDGVKSIGNYAFYGCSELTSVIIPDSTISIGYFSFYSCKKLANLIIGNGVTTIGNRAFAYCSLLKNVSLGNSLITIGDYAFFFCDYITSITIPDEVTSIGKSAFENCSKIESVTFGKSVTSIGEDAFLDCDSLKSVTLPDSLINIGDSAFENCSRLESVTFGNSLKTIGNRAFNDCEWLTNITFPDSVTSIGNFAFRNCDLTNIIIPDSVTRIGDGAFYWCYNLSNVKLGNGVTSIGAEAFAECDNLTSIMIPDGVANIGKDILYNTEIYNGFINEENDIWYIGNHLLKAKTTISGEYVVSDGTKTIADEAFNSCSSLTSVTVPDSVIGIGENAFLDCSDLKDIYYNGSYEQWEKLGVIGLENVTIHCTAYTISWKIDDIIKSESVNVGDEIIIPKDPVKEGYEFDGWDIQIPETMPENNLTITAQFTPITYYATFFIDGEKISTIPYTVESESIMSPILPKREGYTGKWEKYELAIGGVTVNAIYTINSHTVTWIVDGKETTDTYKYGDIIVKPANPEKEGYTFTGWTPVVNATVPDEDLTFTASWQINEYSVKWIIDDVVIESTCEYNSNIKIPELPTKTGYSIVWDKEIPATMPGENLTFIASWAINSYTVTWKYGDKSVQQTYEYNSPIAPPEAEVSGYEFIKWIPETPELMPAEDLVFDAFLASTEFDGGWGTEDNPYLVSTKEQLYQIRNHSDRCFKLTNDIVFTESDFASGGSFYNGGKGWTPIPEFTGVIDGDGYAIRGLKIVSSVTDDSTLQNCSVGFISTLDGEIKNLGLLDGSISVTAKNVKQFYVGAFAGYGYYSSAITNCFNNCDVKCTETLNLGLYSDEDQPMFNGAVGGIAGNGVYVVSSSNEGNVTVNTTTTKPALSWAYDDLLKHDILVGGIVGDDAAVKECYNSGDVTLKFNFKNTSSDGKLYADCNYFAGGIAGEDTSVIDSYNNGNVNVSMGSSGAVYDWALNPIASGIIGAISGYEVNRCYNTGTLSSVDDNCAGITVIFGSGQVYNCYYLDNVEDGVIQVENKGWVSDTFSFSDISELKSKFNKSPWMIDINGVPVLESTIRPARIVEISESEVSVVNKETVQLSATVLPDYATYKDVTWSSSNNTVATVDENGLVTAKKIGEATIRATGLYSNAFAECKVTVTPADFTITWIVDGVETEETVTETNAIVEPETPVKYGYTFSGWTPDIPDVMPDENLIFNGTWAPVECELTFDASTGSWADGTTERTETVDFNSEIVVPEAPSKPGYVFLGWALDNVNLGTDLGEMDDINGKEFKAVWVASTDTRYAVETYTMNTEGEYVKTIQNFTGETDSTVNAEYVIEEGFTLNDEISVLSGTITADNSLVLKVYIDRNVYIFTTIIDGVSTETMYFYDSVIAEPAIPSKTGYTFVDWDKTVPLMMPANDLTITAEFDANSYDALFNANGGKWSDGSTSKMVATDFGSEIVAPVNPIRRGYDFAGWDVEIGIMDDVNGKTFTAKWIARNDTKYTVETYTMGADGKYVVTTKTKQGTTDTVAAAETDIVTGFALNEVNSVLEGTIAGDGTLVLKVYIDRNTYTFTTVVDGVSTSKSYLYGSTVSEPVTPSKPGYKFIKWNGTIPKIMPAENVTVTAVFEKSYICPDCGNEILGEDAINKHIASETKVNIDGGNIVSGVVSPGATITVSAPQTNGKIFSHWEITNATVADADSAETTVVIGSGKISITAVYDDCDCKCHQGGIAGFFFKITLFFQKLFGKNLECVCGAKH